MTTCPKCGTRYGANVRLCPHAVGDAGVTPRSRSNLVPVRALLLLVSALSAAPQITSAASMTQSARAAAPATPTVSFECTGAPEVCLPLRSAIADAVERAGLAVARGLAAPDIVLGAEVTIVEERPQTQFGTNFVVTTYTMDFFGESAPFDQSMPMPAPRTFSTDARFKDRYMENARLAAADVVERVQQSWKKRVP